MRVLGSLEELRAWLFQHSCFQPYILVFNLGLFRAVDPGFFLIRDLTEGGFTPFMHLVCGRRLQQDNMAEAYIIRVLPPALSIIICYPEEIIMQVPRRCSAPAFGNAFRSHPAILLATIIGKEEERRISLGIIFERGNLASTQRHKLGNRNANCLILPHPGVLWRLEIGDPADSGTGDNLQDLGGNAKAC